MIYAEMCVNLHEENKMTNENGSQYRLMREGANKFRIITGLHVLWRLVGSQDKLAEQIGITPRTLRRIFDGHETEIRLGTIQRAARQFVEAHREDVDKYEWAAMLRMLRLIDPTAELLQVEVGKGLSKQVKAHIDKFRGNWPSVWLRHFARQGVSKKLLRTTIRRLVARHPELAEYHIDSKDGYGPELRDPIDKLIRWVGEEEVAPVVHTPKIKKVRGVATRAKKKLVVTPASEF